MSTQSNEYLGKASVGAEIITDWKAHTVDIHQHNGSNQGLLLGGVQVTSTAAELNVNHSVVAGTVSANKVVVAGATKNVDILAIANAQVGASAYPLVDAASCTISGAAGAANVCNVSVQLKDGGGNNITRVVPFSVYASSASNGLTIAAAASTGFAVSAGGLKMPNKNNSITQGIDCVSSAAGAATLTLTDTGKATSYLVLVTDNGITISAQLSAGSYG